MGLLHVVLRVGLAYPLMLGEGIPRTAITMEFPDSGNIVRIDLPRFGPPTNPNAHLGVFDELILHVERQCNNIDGKNVTYANNERLGINRDAGKAFWQLFEHLRDLESQGRFVAIYPVAPAEVIQRNPLVKVCELEWILTVRLLGVKLSLEFPQ